MDWPFHLQEERRREGRAAALEDAHGERPGCRLERQAQAGGRGFMDGLARPPERDEGGAHLGSDREAPQLLVARARQPGKQRVAAGGAQRLLGRPQGIAPARGPDHDKLREVDPCGGQRRRVGQVRRRKPDHALARRGEGRERRQEERELADALAVAENFSQSASRPPSSRQLAVQEGITRGDGWTRAGKRCAAPNGVPLEDFVERRHDTVLLYSITCRPSTSAAVPDRPR